MPSPDQVLEFVRSNAGLKAREIASGLHTDRATVNSLLYGLQRRGKVERDQAYRWRVRDDVPAQPRPTEAQRDSPLSRLCRYYLDCLSQDDQEGVSVFASSSFGRLDYAELRAMPQVLEEEDSVFSDEAPRQLLRRLRSDRDRPSPTLGYPIYLARLRSKNGWEGFVVQPIFLFKLDDDPAAQRELPILAEEPPQINFRAIRSILSAEGGSSIIDEVVELSDDLGLASGWGEQPDLQDFIAGLREARPEWDWKEEIDPTNINISPAIGQLTVPGIYNRAVLIPMENSPYTRGLESELTKLQSLQEAQYAGTSLANWLNSKVAEATIPERQPLIEILPLNSEQRQAVLQGLNNPLTVITGPPGTGKSQVVTSLLINAAWQGKTVLFSSKNNKAVDVVEERVNALGPRPVLLRLGAANQFQAKLAQYLLAFLATTATTEDEERYQEALALHEKARRSFEAISSQMAETIQLRNSVDTLEQAVESIRNDVGPRVFRGFRAFDQEIVQRAIDNFARVLATAQRQRQPLFTRLAWPLLKGKRFEKLANDLPLLNAVTDILGVQQPQVTLDDTFVAKCEGMLALLNVRAASAKKTREYFDHLARLTSAKRLEEITAEHVAAIEEIADVSEALWNSWLRLQPGRMTPEDRRLLGEYVSLLQLIVAANEEGRRLGREVFARYYSLFPKITRILPAWAVTSLAARGKVPFEAEFFDLLIIDEASQCDIASAIPLLFRAKRAVIIGDPMQLRHISAVAPAKDRQLLEKHELAVGGATWAYSVNSVFDLARSLCRSEDIVELRDHHRSHADIIGFSNRHFYGERLRVATRYDALRLPSTSEPSVRWIDVTGNCVRPANGGAINETEAHAVVREIERLVVESGYKGSIGVVTPFRAQANRINDIISQKPELNAMLWEAKFLAQTVDRFQGDERDVMLFSPVISQGAPSGALAFLRGRPNLFNVAITRARATLIVVGDRQTALSCDVQYLSAFAAHVGSLKTNVGRGGRPRQAESEEYPSVAFPDRVSDWEKVLYRALYKAGIGSIPQYDVEKYTLDFAILDGERMLNIEIDGERYHRNWDGELCRRDQIRNQRLFELGWDVIRFWVYQVRDDLDSCLRRVNSWKTSVPSNDADEISGDC